MYSLLLPSHTEEEEGGRAVVWLNSNRGGEWGAQEMKAKVNTHKKIIFSRKKKKVTTGQQLLDYSAKSFIEREQDRGEPNAVHVPVIASNCLMCDLVESC